MTYLNNIFDKDAEIKLDIGCGLYPKKGFIGIDNFVGIESQSFDCNDLLIEQKNIIKHDLNLGIPFSSDSVAEVVTSHFLEHAEDISFILREVHRILRSGGLFEIILPYANSAEGLYPGHKVFFTEKWFLENLLFNNLFRIEKIVFFETELYALNKNKIDSIFNFDQARAHLFNCCNQFQIFCYAKKGELTIDNQKKAGIVFVNIPFREAGC